MISNELKRTGYGIGVTIHPPVPATRDARIDPASRAALVRTESDYIAVRRVQSDGVIEGLDELTSTRGGVTSISPIDLEDAALRRLLDGAGELVGRGAADVLARIIDHRNCPEGGPESEAIVPFRNSAQTSGTALLLVHGVLSSTQGAFAGFASDAGLRKLEGATGMQVLGYLHPTLTKSPTHNAIELAKKLGDANVRDVRVLAHSRGGLVTELLARSALDAADRAVWKRRAESWVEALARSVASDADRARVKDAEKTLADIEELDRVLADIELSVTRVVRAGSPMRGSEMAGRFWRGLEILLNAARFASTAFADPIAKQFFELAMFTLASFARHVVDPEHVPGLAAMAPRSPLVEMLLLAPPTRVHTVALGSEYAPKPGIANFLLHVPERLMRVVHGERHDFAVGTASMRLRPSRVAVSFEDRVRIRPGTWHLNYFTDSSHAVILAALKGEQEPADEASRDAGVGGAVRPPKRPETGADKPESARHVREPAAAGEAARAKDRGRDAVLDEAPPTSGVTTVVRGATARPAAVRVYLDAAWLTRTWSVSVGEKAGTAFYPSVADTLGWLIDGPPGGHAELGPPTAVGRAVLDDLEAALRRYGVSLACSGDAHDDDRVVVLGDPAERVVGSALRIEAGPSRAAMLATSLRELHDGAHVDAVRDLLLRRHDGIRAVHTIHLASTDASGNRGAHYYVEAADLASALADPDVIEAIAGWVLAGRPPSLPSRPFGAPPLRPIEIEDEDSLVWAATGGRPTAAPARRERSRLSLTVLHGAPHSVATELLLLPHYRGESPSAIMSSLDARVGTTTFQRLAQRAALPRPGEVLALPPRTVKGDRAQTVVILGLPSPDTTTPGALADVVARAVRAHLACRATDEPLSIGGVLPGQHSFEALSTDDACAAYVSGVLDGLGETDTGELVLVERFVELARRAMHAAYSIAWAHGLVLGELRRGDGYFGHRPPVRDARQRPTRLRIAVQGSELVGSLDDGRGASASCRIPRPPRDGEVPRVVEGDIVRSLVQPTDLVLELDAASAAYRWEAAVVSDPDGRLPDRALSLRAALLRTFRALSRPLQVMNVSERRAFVLGDPRRTGAAALPGADAEAGEIAQLLRACGYAVQSSQGRLALDELVDGRFSLVHLATHGTTTGAVLLGDGVELRPEDVRAQRHVPAFVFLDCCHVGRIDSLVPALAQAFLERGAQVFVGAAWEVNDAAAATFATTLYSHLESGLPLARASLLAREQTKDKHPHVDTWCAYQVYGDPEFRMRRGQLGEVTGVRRWFSPEEIEDATVTLIGELRASRVAERPELLSRAHELSRALQRWPDYGPAWERLGAAFRQLGELADAAEHYRRALHDRRTRLEVFEAYVDVARRLKWLGLAETRAPDDGELDGIWSALRALRRDDAELSRLDAVHHLRNGDATSATRSYASVYGSSSSGRKSRRVYAEHSFLDSTIAMPEQDLDDTTAPDARDLVPGALVGVGKVLRAEPGAAQQHALELLESALHPRADVLAYQTTLELVVIWRHIAGASWPTREWLQGFIETWNLEDSEWWRALSRQISDGASSELRTA